MDNSLATMNWTCLVYGGPIFIVMFWWVVSARKWFKGPKVNVQHLMLGREGNVIDGEGKESVPGDGSSDDHVDPKFNPDAKAEIN